MLVQLALYQTDRLTVARSKDVVKRFYQDLVPETLRKSLGEFYTPDWLVQFVLDKAAPENWLTCRVLDPTCGSGSFLLEVVRRKREAAGRANWPAERTLRHLVDSVWGFDLLTIAR
jgi:type I restriction-modification system DNA methylase subunit